jgi:MFS family permease
MSACFFAALLYLPQFMQKILDYPPLLAGAGMLPMMGVFAAVSAAAGPLYERLGGKIVVSAGAVCLTAGAFLISLVETDSSWLSVALGMAVLGAGVGLFYSSVTTAAVTALDPARASLAGGVVYMFQIAGGSIGLGLTTTVFTTASEDRLQSSPVTASLTEPDREAVQGVLAGTDSAAEAVAQLSSRASDLVVSVVRDAFAAGMEWGFRLVAALALLGLVVTVLFVGGSLLRQRRRPATESGAAAA